MRGSSLVRFQAKGMGNITQSDTVDILTVNGVAQSVTIYSFVEGTVKVTMDDGSIGTVKIPAMQHVPLLVKRVWDTDTDIADANLRYFI